MASNIICFMACATCHDLNKPSRISVGLTDPITLRVWCRSCDKLIKDFQLAEAVPLQCDVCGTPIGPDHHHHH